MFKRAGFVIQFIVGLMLVGIFLLAYQPGDASISYRITGFSVEERVDDSEGIVEKTLGFFITLYFISIVLIEIFRKKEKSDKEMTVKEILAKYNIKPVPHEL